MFPSVGICFPLHNSFNYSGSEMLLHPDTGRSASLLVLASQHAGTTHWVLILFTPVYYSFYRFNLILRWMLLSSPESLEFIWS